MLDPYLAEWLGLVGRWFHLTLGIAWIGASFYFVWLNNAVRPPEPGTAPERVSGTVWSVHGGAFYCVQKYGGVPEKLPPELHWFKWEAYLTWLSGFYLLVLLYWLSPAATMLPSGSTLPPLAAVGLSAAVLGGGWLFYDLCCRWLGDKPKLLIGVLAAFVAAVDLGLFQVLAPRAAYLHVGAMLGTWMAANVFFVIIPGQRAMVDAMIAGRPAPVERGAAGALRSLHNNYLTLPVLFVMLSGHFPSTWGHPLGWLVLLGIATSGALARHAINVSERGQPAPWLWPLSIAVLAGVALLARPAPPPQSADGAEVSFTKVQMVVAERCLPCHAQQPILGGYATAPKGVILDSPAELERYRESILTQVVQTKFMPLGNLTQMTDEERALIGAWAQR